jgi:hypothetical protein
VPTNKKAIIWAGADRFADCTGTTGLLFAIVGNLI